MNRSENGTASSRSSAFSRQVGWSLAARISAAVLQLAVILLLARGLPPRDFGWVASAIVVSVALAATNGFGLIRQIQYRRSLDPKDDSLAELFSLRLRFTYASSLLWLAGCGVLWAVTADPMALAIMPIAVWLTFEQTTAVWNAISIVDDRARDLLPSWLFRRLPVVLLLLVGPAWGWDVVWCWSCGVAAGSLLAFVTGFRGQEPWARVLWPRRLTRGDLHLDLGYWWSEVGSQIRDVDVATVALVNAAAGGLYALPARLVKPMNLVTVSAASVAFPRLARMSAVSRSQLTMWCLVGTLPVLVVASAVALCAPVIPVLVGDDYAATVTPMRILCLAAVITGFGALVLTFLQSRSKESTAFAGYAVLIFGVLQVGTAAVGATWAGAAGAAWAATATQSILVLILWARALRQCALEAAAAQEQRAGT